MASKYENVVDAFRRMHEPDAKLAHGFVNNVGVTGKPKERTYNLMLPYNSELGIMTSSSVDSFVATCMDYRVSYPTYEVLKGDGINNIIVATAGGGATGVEEIDRFETDVNFWVNTLRESSSHPILYLLGHDEGCAWIKKAVSPEKVLQWQQAGKEDELVAKRLLNMRDRIATKFSLRFHKPTISVGIAHVGKDNNFSHIGWWE